MSLVTKPSRRRSTDIAVDSIVRNHPEYPEYEKSVHPSRRPQRAGLIAEEAPTKVPVEYADFAFSPDLASKLPEHTGINNYAIELVDVNGFIRPSKSPNRYLLPLVEELLDRLKRARRFTQLDLTSAYHRMRIREEGQMDDGVPDLVWPL